MNFLEEFQHTVLRCPKRVALVDYNGRRTTSYQELDGLSRRVAAKLRRLGVQSGQAVMVCMDRRMEYIAAEIGILMAGSEIAVGSDWLAEIPQIDDHDRVLIIYTSGSNGRPKGIVHTMVSFTQGIYRLRSALCIEEQDVMAAMAPMSFIAILHGIGLAAALSAPRCCACFVTRGLR